VPIAGTIIRTWYSLSSKSTPSGSNILITKAATF
jgi:hypothetical protein